MFHPVHDAVRIGLMDPITHQTTPPMLMPAHGNVADTEIAGDYDDARAEAIRNRQNPPSKCEWLEQNKRNYSADRVKATQKAWECRGSRHS